MGCWHGTLQAASQPSTVDGTGSKQMNERVGKRGSLHEDPLLFLTELVRQSGRGGGLRYYVVGKPKL